MKLADAKEIAEALVEYLRDYCERIQIAGSVRRGRPEVKDVEIVAIPKTVKVLAGQADLDGNRHEREANGLWEAVARLKKAGVLSAHPTDPKEGGEKYRKLWHVAGKVSIDLFTAEPRNWGNIFALRTGPWTYSRWLVTLANRRGYTAKKGLISRNNEIIPIVDEFDFFKRVGEKWIPPERRDDRAEALIKENPWLIEKAESKEETPAPAPEPDPAPTEKPQPKGGDRCPVCGGPGMGHGAWCEECLDKHAPREPAPDSAPIP